MDIFTLEPLPAKHGDCLLLHYGPADKPGTVVIDGGPSGVYPTLKKRLQAIAAARPGGPFAIELMMVSHIDQDHIIGINEFAAEWRDAVRDRRKWPLKVNELWHNSFERIAGGDPNAVQASITASFGVAKLADIVDRDAEDHQTEDVFKVLASVGDGADLRKHAEVIGIPTNSGFDGLVVPPADKQPIPFDGKLKLHVVGPLPDQIERLRKEFARKLPKGPAASLAAYADTSIANLSSIVVLARYGTKSILLTGDARGDYILDGLKEQGLLNARGKLKVNVLKLQHHGSDRNTEVDFFRKVTADHYVASADGLHENPDRETFEMLAKARGKAARYTIHLTHEVEEMDPLRKTERAATIKDALKRGRKPPPAWKDEADALSVFFARCKAEGYAFQVTTPATRTTACIDLLAKVTY